MSRLTVLEAMADVTSRMVDAAIRNDWDELARLEHQQAKFRDELMAFDAHGSSTAGDAPTESDKRAATLIEQMLADHDTIQRHARPWLDSVKSLLSGAKRDRQIRSTYGSGSM